MRLDGLQSAWTELQLAVLDRLARTDDDDPVRAGLIYRRLTDRLNALTAEGGTADDLQLLEEARQRVNAYWLGGQRILDLRRQRDRLGEDTLRPISVDFRLRLQRITGGGKPTEAPIAADAVISMLLVQQYADHYIIHRDADNVSRVRLELEAIVRRLVELGKLPLEQPSRTVVGEVGALLKGYAVAFEQLAIVVAEETKLIAETIDRSAMELSALLASQAVEGRSEAPASPILSKPIQAQPIHNATWLEATTVKPSNLRIVTIITISGLVLVIVLLLLFRGRHRTAVAPESVGSLVRHREDLHTEEKAPPEPERGISERVVVAGVDWLAGVGRSVAMLHATDGELTRLREHAERIQAQLTNDKIVAETRNRAMAGFIAHLGDKLQGPLSTIISHGDQVMADLDRLGASSLTPDIEMIQWSGEQLLRMVEALRGVAEIEAGTLTVNREDFLVDHLVGEIRERLRPLTNLYGNRFNVQTARGIGLMHSDFQKLRTALFHLLENACKFSENGDVTLVVMRIEEDGQPQVRFTVTDTGPGISADHINRIFDPFVAFGSERCSGAGLGLTLVHHYAVALGGSIEVNSNPGRGSCFVLTLPVDSRNEQTYTAPLDQTSDSLALANNSPVLKLAAPPPTPADATNYV